jgi:hypothetical protein
MLGNAGDPELTNGVASGGGTGEVYAKRLRSAAPGARHHRGTANSPHIY